MKNVPQQLFTVLIMVMLAAVVSAAPSPISSPELNLAEYSPRGAAGGSIIPASCPSNLHDAPWYGQPCNPSNACGETNSGSTQCDGSCSVGAPPTLLGQPCTVTNVCGVSASGTYRCDGTCTATAPPPPSNYGTSCTGPANSCGLRSFGSIGCTNNCSAQFAPPESQCQEINTATAGTTLTASPLVTGINGYSDLSWQSNQPSCSLYNPASGVILATSTSGTLRVGPLSSATRYILTCGGKTVTITVRTDFKFNEF